MNNLHLLNKAVRFSTEVHRTQKRKGKDVPYITHPLTVALILSRVTKDENIIIAGILHDTMEDCVPYGSITKEFIESEFNANIARMVNDLTEEDKTLPWMERKLAALKHIPHMSHDSLLVKSADVLHNLSELNDDIARDGESVFKKFNASKEDTILRYKKLIPEIKKAWIQNPLMIDLEYELDRLLKLSSSYS